MPRPLRVDFDGAWHHVVNRGIAHARIFNDQTDYRIFTESLTMACSRHHIDICCFCLMPNHYHLLLRSTAGQLPDAMRYAIGRFTRLKNARCGRDGPLFRGRYYSSLVDNDTYTAEVSRYIHLNPVTAGLARSACEWTWSSARAYMGLEEKPAWLETELLLSIFGSLPDQFSRYAQFIAEGVDASKLRRMAEFDS